MNLERPLVHPPEFPLAEWLNSTKPLTLSEFRGRVVLIDIWDFT